MWLFMNLLLTSFTKDYIMDRSLSKVKTYINHLKRTIIKQASKYFFPSYFLSTSPPKQTSEQIFHLPVAF
jgi:hypothetical protein